MKKKKIPLRKCVGCGEMKNKKELIRVVKSKEGEITLDITGKKNGRGVYICNDISCFEKARKNKGLERSIESKISNEIYDSIEKELKEHE